METSCWPSPLSKACTWLHPTRSPVVAGYLGQKFALPRIQKKTQAGTAELAVFSVASTAAVRRRVAPHGRGGPPKAVRTRTLIGRHRLALRGAPPRHRGGGNGVGARAVAIITGGADPGALRRRRNAPNNGAWPRTRFADADNGRVPADRRRPASCPRPSTHRGGGKPALCPAVASVRQ